MSEFRINFSLKDLKAIVPFGENRDLLSWFGLTDALLWISFGKHAAIYKYSDKYVESIENTSGVKRSCYNDYYLSRFLEDFTGIMRYVSEPVPKLLYDVVGEFINAADKWRCIHLGDNEDDIPDGYFEFEENEYLPLTEWFYNRTFDSGHLVDGPLVGFFRYGNKIKVRWVSDYDRKNGESIWTVPCGNYEIMYSEFVAEVKRFFGEFYEKMDEQVNLALSTDWGDVRLDKELLVQENAKRKIYFNSQIALLENPLEQTDWVSILSLYEKMRKEQRCSFREIRFSFDYRHCLWTDGGALSPSALPISNSLLNELNSMCNEFCESLDWSDLHNPSPWTKKQFTVFFDRAELACKKLQRELDGKTVVINCIENDRRMYMDDCDFAEE